MSFTSQLRKEIQKMLDERPTINGIRARRSEFPQIVQNAQNSHEANSDKARSLPT